MCTSTNTPKTRPVTAITCLHAKSDGLRRSGGAASLWVSARPSGACVVAIESPCCHWLLVGPCLTAFVDPPIIAAFLLRRRCVAEQSQWLAQCHRGHCNGAVVHGTRERATSLCVLITTTTRVGARINCVARVGHRHCSE